MVGLDHDSFDQLGYEYALFLIGGFGPDLVEIEGAKQEGDGLEST